MEGIGWDSGIHARHDHLEVAGGEVATLEAGQKFAEQSGDTTLGFHQGGG